MAEQRRNDNSEYVKEQNHVYARRMITTIAITLTILAVFLVTLSLLLGSRIDQIVNETFDTNMKISGSELFLGPKTNVTNFDESETTKKT
uniref:Nematode cuticle collagen N-terminal domain-containing protein n=2 Tax=Wuchereria bancrofti TaxID=6293 RepID=A0A1I8EF10_WUCBA